MFLVYQATFPNSKCYIGITNNLPHRMNQHRNAADRGSQLPFHRAIRKYGMPAFIVVHQTKSWNQATQLEQDLIAKFKSNTEGYNATSGGEGTPNRTTTEDSRLRYSLSKLGPKNPQYGKKQSKECIRRRTQSLIGRKRPPHVIEILRKKAMGNTIWRGRKHKPSSCKKISETLRGRKQSESHRILNATSHGAKPFLVHTLKGEFVGRWLIQSDCARSLNLQLSKLNLCLHGHRRTHKGYTFSYESS